MKVNIKATKMEISEKTREFIQEKMDMLDKYLGTIKPLNCAVEIEKFVGEQKNGRIYRCEVNLSLPHEMIRIEKTASEITKAIEKVKDHLPRSIKKYKEKMIDSKRQPKK